jgi:hypothetical protein
LIAAAAKDPALAAVMTCARGSTTLPAAQTPGTLVRPVGSVVTQPFSSAPVASCCSRSPWPTAGRLRLRLAEHDLTLEPGEAAEFDTRLPHWFGSTGRGLVEILGLFGRQGERMHVRVRPRPRGKSSG